MEKSIAVLIAGYFIAGFALQPAWMGKHKSSNLQACALHGLLHATAAYIVFQSWMYWKLPVVVFLTHSLIDVVKRRCPDTSKAFAITQVAHLAGIIFVVMGLKAFVGLPEFAGVGFTAIVVVGGFVCTVQGAGDFVGKFTQRLLDQNKLKTDGLKNGGKRIGQLERALIFVLIFIDYPSGIGFLVAAKSILRFEESRKQKLAEYVLIGTLMSFMLAIVIASITKWAITIQAF